MREIDYPAKRVWTKHETLPERENFVDVFGRILGFMLV